MNSNRHESIKTYDIFMGVVGLISLGLISFRFTLDDSNEVARLVDGFDTAICVLFFLDFWRNCWRSPDLKRYITTWGILDLISAIPVGNSFRWARLARLIRVFRLIKSFALIARAIRHERKSALLIGTMATATFTLAICSISVLHLEKDVAGANIRTAPDAVWWSVVTLTSVGYGDHFPITPAGKFMAGWLMLTGVMLVGAFAGIFADLLRSISWESSEPHSVALLMDEHTLLRSLTELRQELNELSVSLKKEEPGRQDRERPFSCR